MRNRSFLNSINHLIRAERSIPLGSQTFSKSRTQYPVGVSPLYARNAKDSYLWDIDGNKYIDLVASLGAVTIGYRNRHVDSAVKSQLKKGVTLSLPFELEAEVAELLLELLPDAEMVRFAKNGSDVTTAAVRLARHVTEKKLVIRVGYHGWHDWYIGTTSRSGGVPDEISKLTKVLAFNDTEGAINLFNLFGNSIACVILEPVGATFPTNDFIYTLRNLCDKNGALLIYDEVLTGFRISRNGASSLIGVTPDLSCFGKGVANGYPLSVLAGKRKFMKEVENIFFSGTFGGEALSLSAAKSVLLQIRDDGLIEALYDKGREIEERVNKVMADLKITFLELSGHPSWLFLKWNVPEPEINEVKTLFLQEMLARGVLILNTHNVMTSLKKKDIESIVVSYRETLSLLLEAFQNKNYSKYLKVDAIQPLFQIRK